jgi:serine/threonine protein phosphatase PrpC
VICTIGLAAHRGRVREGMEDAIGVTGWALQAHTPDPLSMELSLVSKPVTLVVCDGMGGYQGGATASRQAAEHLSSRALWNGHTPNTAESAVADSCTALRELSANIDQRAMVDSNLRGMGTTAVGLHLFPDGTALGFNVGDSTLARVVDGGHLGTVSTPDRSTTHGSTLSQGLGAGLGSNITPHTFVFNYSAEALFLLCTDGITDMLTHDEIRDTLTQAIHPARIAQSLVEQANRAGGNDNISALVALTRR